MTRLTAALIHLAISSIALIILACITLFVWYPNPHYKYEGVLEILGLIALIDVVLGPIFTFIVFKQGKPSLKFDLSVIALVQIAALVYGIYTIHSQHPEFVTYVKGKMITVPTSAIDEKQIKDDSLKRSFHIGPKLAVSRLPADPKVISDFVVASITKGKALETSPELYNAYPPKLTDLAENALDLAKIYDNQGNKNKIDDFLQQNKLSREGILLLPLISHLRSSIMVVDKKTGMPLGYLDIRP